MKAPGSDLDVPLQLDKFQKFVAEADWQNVKAVLENQQTDPQEFFTVIPRVVAELALFLRTPLLFEALSARVAAPVRGSLQTAKAAAETHFAGLEKHPVASKLIRERAQSISSSQKKDESNLLTEFSGFEATPFWLESGEALVPAVTITLRGVANKVLLRSNLDWDDLSFFAFVLIDLMKDEFARGSKMSSSYAVKIPQRNVISERIAQIRTGLEELERLAPSLEIRHSENAGPTVEKSATSVSL